MALSLEIEQKRSIAQDFVVRNATLLVKGAQATTTNGARTYALPLNFA
ncbi:MAG TPA: hypothetical protein V6C85_26150 [Allocoleopsis sp.]